MIKQVKAERKMTMEDMINLTISERIQAGMAFLDQHYPGHVERFNPTTFNILRPSSCALAQAARKPWGDAFLDHDIDIWTEAGIARSENLGFSLATEADGMPLQQGWIDAYAARRNG